MKGEAMKVSLYEHNLVAYRSSVSMLAELGKAAVIHPTGTGKSFIGFRLCADNPSASVCWLSPSDYIFRTQLENLRASAGDVPANIKFFTYAKLMNMTDEELAEITPDYIILDEFHRCGAQMWGAGVKRLLSLYSDVPVLGFSSTAIRYLDGQRNMADELFDGCVSSEITLAEAIVRGILDPPKYVLSLFKYQNILERYKKRVKHAKNRAVRDKAELLLDSLRRALEKAEGLDVIFDKHMSDRCGKYIVFCSNYIHLQKMKALAPDWFKYVDKDPHIYTAYADDPETIREYEAFKADDSDHLKLLFCIDMFNEGVHVDGVSGVILLRPTVSPIIYKQQIGRALAAGKKGSAVIFDIVLNIENLYSISALEDEMRMATVYYRSMGMGEAVVNDAFSVVDEVRDCMELFDKLGEALGASWDAMYGAAKEYAEENGDLDVPRRYVTKEGYTLGTWIMTQRLVNEGKVRGILTNEQKNKLDEIGMRCESSKDASFERYFSAAKKYFREHGNLMVNVKDGIYEGVNLASWISNLRTYYKSGVRTSYLTPERIQALEKIGMVWSAVDFLWERNYDAAVRFYEANGHLDVPASYVDSEGIRLGAWIYSVRGSQNDNSKRAPLTDLQKQRLDSLGMIWGSKQDITWEKNFIAVCEYRRTHGNKKVPSSYETRDGLRIGRWLRTQRDNYMSGTLTRERLKRLEAAGIDLRVKDPWMAKFELLEEYYKANGNTRIPADYVVNGVWLSRWLYEQMARLNGKSKKTLTHEQIGKLATVKVFPK